MAILTARQPDAPVVDTRGLVRDAFGMIQSELAARTNIGLQLAQMGQQDVVNQARLRQEIGQIGNDRYTKERQLRLDDLNQRLQLGQEARAERRLALDERMSPLEYAQKQLALQAGAQNLQFSQQLQPLKLENAALDNAAASSGLQSAELNREVTEAKIPVLKAEADLALQNVELQNVARTSLKNVKSAEEIAGWADSQLANLPGDPDQQAAEVKAHINTLGLPIIEQAKAERAITTRIQENKQLTSNNASLFPDESLPMAKELAVSGSSFAQYPNGRTFYLSQVPLPEVNRAREEVGKPPMSPAEYAALPKPPTTASMINALGADERIDARILQSEATKLMDLAKTAMNDGSPPAVANEYFRKAEEKYAEARAVGGSGTIDPTAPSAAPAVPTTSTNPRRAAVLPALTR